MALFRQAALRPICRICAGPSSSRSLVATRLLHGQGHSRQRQQPFAAPERSGSYVPRERRGSGDSRGARGQFKSTPSRFRDTKVPPVPTKIEPETLPRIMMSRVEEWTRSEDMLKNLHLIGFKPEEADDCLSAWSIRICEELQTWDTGDESLLPKMASLGWDAQALITAYETGEYAKVFDSAFLRHFITYASEDGPERLQLHLKSVLRSTDLSNIAQTYEKARTINRHFHLHMGPTNSGKTYNAIKALSKAGTGVYAGPLRLLAHEVWERINFGTVGELNGKGRECNLLTGEERRIVSNDAGLVSCTVEMLPLRGAKGGEPWDVVVIDEIQMMGDSQRGGSWTAAVMGAFAKEIHLCGDDTTAALLQSMIDSFGGDTLTIHRYDRLTPLRVAETSLDGKLDKVEPGDCVVTFSRSNVYSVKKEIEGKLSKRCAVVYGALPPETRAEQARDFNEESGRAEILVASDAVGMGLNLKINRIIFESLSKFDGKNEVPLSLSQIKQIAGRAGRFGQERTEGTITDETPTPGGTVTTLHEADLPLLRAMLPLPLPPLTRASLDIPNSNLEELLPLLPPSATHKELFTFFAEVAKLPTDTVLTDVSRYDSASVCIEPYRNTLTLEETDTFSRAPVALRDDRLTSIYRNMIAAYAEDFHVDLDEILAPSTLLKTLTTVEETLAALPPLPPVLGVWRPYLVPPITISSIPLMETLHKALVLYLWLSYRLELAFPDRELATAYKKRTEKVLEVCLERLPGLRPKKKGERTKEMDREHALYRRKYVDKHGLVKPSIEWVDRQTADMTKREQTWKNLAVILEEPAPKH